MDTNICFIVQISEELDAFIQFSMQLYDCLFIPCGERPTLATHSKTKCIRIL